MADWTSGFDAMRSALQFKKSQQAQEEQAKALADYRQNTLEQQAVANEATAAYRKDTLAQQQNQANRAFELEKEKQGLAVDKQMFDQDQLLQGYRPGNYRRPGSGFQSMLPGMPGYSPQPPQMGMGMGMPMQGQNPFGPTMVLSGTSVGADGQVRNTYKSIFETGPPQLETVDLGNGVTQQYITQKNPDTGRKEYTKYVPPVKPVTDDDTVTLANVGMAFSSLDNLERAVRQHGGYESSMAGLLPMKDAFAVGYEDKFEQWKKDYAAGKATMVDKPNLPSDSAATLLADPYELAIAMAKVVDPGSVAREGEVAAAQKFLVPLGFGDWGVPVSSKATLAAIKRLREQLNTRVDYLGFREDFDKLKTSHRKNPERPRMQKFDSMEDFENSGNATGQVWDPSARRWRAVGY